MTPRTLVQLFLPLYGNDGAAQPRDAFAKTRQELIGVFGGITAYTRAPAEGVWEEPSGRTVKDDVVVYEVICERLEVSWWHAFRAALERRFRQERILVRAQEVRLV
jgi:hypothetical protein